MSTLRLGVHQLPAAEVVLVQTLLRLYGHGKNQRWTLADRPPYDALLVDALDSETNAGDLSRMAKAILKITRKNAASQPDTLERPIRADKLQAWLAGIERESVSARPEDAGREDADSADAALLAGTVRFKLHRWPPAVLLRGDPQRIRLATLLSKRALTLNQLALLSNQEVEQCRRFVQVLQNTGVVQAQDVVAPALPPAASAETPTAPARFARGLIHGIRRRLGL